MFYDYSCTNRKFLLLFARLMRKGLYKMKDILARNIRRRRQILGLDQGQMADRIGVSRITFSKYENGKATITDDVFYRLSRIFGISPAALLESPDRQSAPLFRHKKVYSQQERAGLDQMNRNPAPVWSKREQTGFMDFFYDLVGIVFDVKVFNCPFADTGIENGVLRYIFFAGKGYADGTDIYYLFVATIKASLDMVMTTYDVTFLNFLQ